MKQRFMGVIASFSLTVAYAATVRADVTVQQNTYLNVASLIKMHGSTTTNIATDKKREDTESHCEGIMSLVCGNLQSGEIIRLDKDVTWHLEPKKKHYIEQVFATPEELAAMRAKMQANLEKMQSCPVSQKQQPIDKSKCEMSAPKFEVHRTDDAATIAGHAAQRTAATMTTSCTDKDTGEVCDTIVAVDVWLTQDKLPGLSDRTTFDTAYAKKLGLADTVSMMKGQAAPYLAPYMAQIKQLADKSADFKGQPMKSTFRVMMGGKTCTSMAKAKSSDASGNADSANPIAGAAEASKALGSLVGGLFKKKKTDDSSDSSTTTSAAQAESPDIKIPDQYAQFNSQMAAFSIETVSISSDPVTPTRFDVPADWTKDTPKTAKEEEYTCPKT